MNSSTKPAALVTGALGGIGLAAVGAFVEAGWTVLAVDRKEGELAIEYVEYFQLDVSVPGDM